MEVKFMGFEPPEEFAKNVEREFNRISEYYAPFGYSCEGVDVEKIKKEGTRWAGLYLGREGERVRIGDKSLLGLWDYVHELLHDVFRYLVKPKVRESPLVVYTLSELFACLGENLCFKQYFPECELDEPSEKKYENSFAGLRRVLNARGRPEREICERIIRAFERGKYDKALKEIEKLCNPSEIYSPASDMFVENILKEVSEAAKKVKKYVEILSSKKERRKLLTEEIYASPEISNEVRKHKKYRALESRIEALEKYLSSLKKRRRELENEYGRALYSLSRCSAPEKKARKEYANLLRTSLKVLERIDKLERKKDRLAERLRKRIAPKLVLKYLTDKASEEMLALNRKIEEFGKRIEEVRDSEALADFVFESIKHEYYGEEYDIFFDFPHYVGKKLACRLYYEGVEPSDIIRSPKQYAELCKREIKRTIKRGLIS